MNKVNNIYDQLMEISISSRDIFEEIEETTRELINTEDVYRLRDIYIVGCGDSYAAGLTLKSTFEKLTYISTDVVEPYEMLERINSGYFDKHSARGVLVIGISTSGNTQEVVDAIKKSSDMKMLTLGITTNDSSLLAKESKYVIARKIKEYKGSPGVLSFVFSMYALSSLAIRISEIKLVTLMDDAAVLRDNLLKPFYNIDVHTQRVKERINQLEIMKKYKNIEFLGFGSTRGTSFYSAAKFYEMCGVRTTDLNIGEWRHLSCFIRDNSSLLSVIIVANEFAYNIFKEIESKFQKLKRDYIVVAPLDIIGESIINYDCSSKDEFSAVYAFLPSLIIAEMFTEKYEEEYFRGFIGKWEGI